MADVEAVDGGRHDESRRDDGPRWEAVPQELRERRQWVVWRLEPRKARKDGTAGKPQKVPYTPGTGRKADATDPDTWRSFEDALATLATGLANGQWQGIGYVLSAGDPFVGVDLDQCRHETGEWSRPARVWMTRLNSYSEVSPSGTGIRIFVRGTLPEPGRRDATRGVELYAAEHFLTVTGQHIPGAPESIEQREAEVNALFTEVFGATPRSSYAGRTGQTGARRSKGRGATVRSRSVSAEPLSREDEDLIEMARAAANGHKFSQLWAGAWESLGVYGSQSEADQAFCTMLAFWTDRDAERMDRLFRHSGLSREKWDTGKRLTYGDRTINKAIESVQNVRRDASAFTLHVHSWQRRTETQAQRDSYLWSLVRDMIRQVRRHLLRQEPGSVFVVAVPPGVGKSHGIAALGGGEFNLAWVAERHEMVESVNTLQPPHYRHIQACTPKNCPAADLHSLLAKQGRNTWSVHKQHQCDYRAQLDGAGSAVYMLPHVRSSYPVRHDHGIVVDELDVGKWLTEREIPWGTLRSVVVAFERGTTAARLARALEEVLDEAARLGQRAHDNGERFLGWQGRELLDHLDTACDGQLAVWVDELRGDVALMDPLPWVEVDLNDLRAAKERLSQQPPVILPHVVRALSQELAQWRGRDRAEERDWNARLRVGKARSDEAAGTWAFFVSEPLQFTPPQDGPMPPVVVLDATADEDLYQRLFRTKQVEVWTPAEVTPPPHMRHIAVRVKGKRYGQTSLKGKDGKALRRTIAEVAHVLQRLDPDGALRAADRVGLITFKDVEQRMAEALGITYDRCTGHFWAMRGSNKLAKCDILLVVGTPVPNLDSIVRMARNLYWDDVDPIKEESEADDEDVHRRYADPRLQRLVDYLAFAELTQMAHRNRPLRFDGRTVVTFCAGDIGFLPATTTYTHLPERLDSTGETARAANQRQRDDACACAAGALEAVGTPITVATLAKHARVATAQAADWLRRYRLGEVTPTLC